MPAASSSTSYATTRRSRGRANSFHLEWYPGARAMVDTPPDTPPDPLDSTHIGLAGTDRTIRGDGESLPSVERRHLLVFAGNTSWMYELPTSGTVGIGRSETSDLRIDDPS